MNSFYTSVFHVWDVYANGELIGDVKERVGPDPDAPEARALMTARTHLDIPLGAKITIKRRENPFRPQRGENSLTSTA